MRVPLVGSRPAVVVADEAWSARSSYRTGFEAVGFRVGTADTGQGAVELVREFGAVALVIDADLSDMSGEEVLDQLRADPETEDVSVVMVTASDSRDRMVAALDRGVDDYLTKPVEARELVARVGRHLQVRDRWLTRAQSAGTLRERIAQQVAGVDAGLPLVELVAPLADALRPTMGVTALMVTPAVAAGLGRPAGVGDDTELRVLADGAKRALAGPVVDRRPGAMQVHVPLESSDEVFAIFGLSISGSADRLVAAVLDLRGHLSMLLRPAVKVHIELGRTRDLIDSMVRDRSIVPVFQPIVELATRRIVGFEGLSRFPDGIPPDAWFRHAAGLGLGPRLEVAAIHALLDAAAPLPGAAFLTLNVSAETVLCAELAPVLAGSARRLVVEITEHDLVSDYQAVRDTVARLHGVGLCVDDAGSGHSSLQHVLRLRPELVKLDREWIANLDQDPARQALVSGLLSFTGRLGAALLGEGIETDGERHTLIDLGVRLGQGYLLGAPASAQQWT